MHGQQGRPLDESSIDVELEAGKTQEELHATIVGAQGKIGNASESPLTLPGIVNIRTPQIDDAAEVDAARKVSVASLAASIILALLAFSIGISENVLSVVGFGMEATLDGISSALVLWRFKKGKKRDFKDSEAAARAKEVRDGRRERNSSIGIGATFVVSAFLLLVSAAWKIFGWDPTTEEHVEEEHLGAMYTTLLSWPSAALFGFLAVWKFRLSKALGSQVLEKDALCSMLGALLALICAVAAAVEQGSESDPKAVAGVDAAAGVLIAAILAFEGVRTLRHNLSGWETSHQELA
mmetsp:Transcript_10838/g.19267  ORF Transcript_10838/g.19267 Transcript_10838/m.19267 type:complete len:295 (-) Transcript_10838:47-931(-)